MQRSRLLGVILALLLSGAAAALYPHAAAVRFVVDIWINKRRFDHKDQDYPPHGSVPASAIGSGDLFRLEGQAFNARGARCQAVWTTGRPPGRWWV